MLSLDKLRKLQIWILFYFLFFKSAYYNKAWAKEVPTGHNRLKKAKKTS